MSDSKIYTIPDGYDGIVFNRWYADTVHLGIPIDWDEMV